VTVTSSSSSLSLACTGLCTVSGPAVRTPGPCWTRIPHCTVFVCTNPCRGKPHRRNRPSLLEDLGRDRDRPACAFSSRHSETWGSPGHVAQGQGPCLSGVAATLSPA
jgi:hypothetical protein